MFLLFSEDSLRVVKIHRLVGLLLLAEVHGPCSEIVRQHTGRK